jgi:hypothetical protein
MKIRQVVEFLLGNEVNKIPSIVYRPHFNFWLATESKLQFRVERRDYFAIIPLHIKDIWNRNQFTGR